MSNLPEYMRERVHTLLEGYVIRAEVKRFDACDKIEKELLALLEEVDRKARIDELRRPMTLDINIASSKNFNAGFSSAINQINDIKSERIESLTKESK